MAARSKGRPGCAGRPKKLLDEEQLYQAALRALGRRAHSRFELRGFLQRRSEDFAAIRRVLRRLADHGYLDDARFARAYASYRARVKRFGRYRITRELRQRGVADEFIEKALAEALGEADEMQMLRARLVRRLRHLKLPLGARDVRRLYAALLRAGFPSEIITRELRRLTKANIEEFTVEHADES